MCTTSQFAELDSYCSVSLLLLHEPQRGVEIDSQNGERFAILGLSTQIFFHIDPRSHCLIWLLWSEGASLMEKGHEMEIEKVEEFFF